MKYSYAVLIDKHDYCIRQAINYALAKDYDMAAFYKHAAEGYKKRALLMEVPNE